MTKTLTFEIAIRAPRARVWDIMLDPETYKAWTSAFCEGSYFVGSWDEGAKIQFLSPSGDGMTAVIAENRPHEFVSIRHLGVIEKGVEDTSSAKVRAWAPAYENYRFSDCRTAVASPWPWTPLPSTSSTCGTPSRRRSPCSRSWRRSDRRR